MDVMCIKSPIEFPVERFMEEMNLKTQQYLLWPVNSATTTMNNHTISRRQWRIFSRHAIL